VQSRSSRDGSKLSGDDLTAALMTATQLPTPEGWKAEFAKLAG